MGGQHHGGDGIGNRREIEVVGADHDDVGLLARCQRADLMAEPIGLRTCHGGEGQHVAQ